MEVRLWIRLEIFDYVHCQFARPKSLPLPLLRRLIQDLANQQSPDQRISFGDWRESAQRVLAWQPSEVSTFWRVLSFYDRISTIDTRVKQERNLEDSLIQQPLNLYKIIIGLFFYTAKHPNKYQQTFQAVWYEENAVPKTDVYCPFYADQKAHFQFVSDCLHELLDLLFGHDDDQLPWAKKWEILGFLIGGTVLHENSNNQSMASEVSSLSQLYHYATKDDEIRSNKRIEDWIRQHLRVNEDLYPNTRSQSKNTIQIDRNDFEGHLEFSAVDAVVPNLKIEPKARPMVINGLQKTTRILTPADFRYLNPNSLPSEWDLIVYGCEDLYLYALAPLRHVTIIGCKNCQVVTCTSDGFVTIDRCDLLVFSGLVTLLRVSNSCDSLFNIHSCLSSIFMGENLGLTLGPFNIRHFFFDHGEMNISTDPSRWDQYINLDSEEDGVITIQDPTKFKEIVIPFIEDNMNLQYEEQNNHNYFSFGLPEGYLYEIEKRNRKISNLRSRIDLHFSSLECNDPKQKKRDFDRLVQSNFKEWLSTSGNLRQIVDLYQLEST